MKTVGKIRYRLFGSQTRRNVSASAIASAANAAVGLFSYPLALHYLGLKVYGVWLIVSVVLTVAQLGSFGMGPAVTNLVARERAGDSTKGIERCLATAYLIVIPVGCGLFAAIICSADLLIEMVGLVGDSARIAKGVTPAAAALMGYLVVAQIGPAGLAGMGRTDKSSVFGSVGRISFLLVSWICLALGKGIYSLIFGHLVGALVPHLLSEISIRSERSIRVFARGNVSHGTLSTLLRFGAGVVGTNAVQLLLLPLNRIILSRFAGIEAVPLFEIAWGGSFQIRALLGSALQALLPDFTAAHTQGDIVRTRSLLKKAYSLIFMMGLPAYLIIFALAHLLLRVWLGDDFQVVMVACFRTMLIGTFLSLIAVPGYFHLLGIGRVRDTFSGQLILTICNAAMAGCLVYSSRISVLGLCATVSTALALSTIWYVWRSLRAAW